jgi:hypothetical protein
MAETKGTGTKAAPTDAGEGKERKAALDEHAEAVRRYTEAHTKPSPPAAAERGLRFTAGVGPDAEDVDLGSVGSSSEATTVTVDHDVYEHFPAPGAPTKTITRLLYHKGQQVPKAALQAHADRQSRANA